MIVLLILLAIAFCVLPAFSWLGSYIAEQKNRSRFEGAWLGFLFGPFGCLIEALMPSSEREREQARTVMARHHVKVDDEHEDAVAYLNTIDPPKLKKSGEDLPEWMAIRTDL